MANLITALIVCLLWLSVASIYQKYEQQVVAGFASIYFFGISCCQLIQVIAERQWR
jgi:hypothetical protein